MLKFGLKVLPLVFVFVWLKVTSPVAVRVISLANRSSWAVTVTVKLEPVLTVLPPKGCVIATVGAVSGFTSRARAGCGYDRPRLPILSWATAFSSTVPSFVSAIFWVYGAALSVATSTSSTKKSTKATSVSATVTVNRTVLPLIGSAVGGYVSPVIVGTIVSIVLNDERNVPMSVFPTASLTPLTDTVYVLLLNRPPTGVMMATVLPWARSI